jgi:hypothetical protein
MNDQQTLSPAQSRLLEIGQLAITAKSRVDSAAQLQRDVEAGRCGSGVMIDARRAETAAQRELATAVEQHLRLEAEEAKAAQEAAQRDLHSGEDTGDVRDDLKTDGADVIIPPPSGGALTDTPNEVTLDESARPSADSQG